MKLSELRETTDQMIKNLVDELGLDGDSYVSSTNNYLMTFGNIIPPGKFYSAGSHDLFTLLKKSKSDDKTKKYIFSEGLIIINKDYKNKPMDENLLVTCIHERLHSNRMLLAAIPDSGDEDIDSIFYDKGRFVRNSRETKDAFIDPAQEILLGSIDTSKDEVDLYNKLSKDKKLNLYYENGEIDDKLINQYKIDETLVDLMAMIAFLLSTGEFASIMDIVKDINKRYKADDIHGMTNIILRHNDLELFKWMLDPLTYQGDDIHYDYFSHYTNDDDQQDIKDIIESEELMVDDDEIDRIALEMRTNERAR